MRLANVWALLLNNRAKKGSGQVLENLRVNSGSTVADIELTPKS